MRHYALKVETLVNQGWFNEYPSTKNLNCNELFIRYLPKIDSAENAKLNAFRVHLNLPSPLVHWWKWLILKTLEKNLKPLSWNKLSLRYTSNPFFYCWKIFPIATNTGAYTIFFRFVTKTSTKYLLVIAGSICSRNLNHDINHLHLAFINNLKHLIVNLTITFFVIVVEATINLTETLLKTVDTNFVPIRVLTPVLGFLAPANNIIFAPTLVGFHLAVNAPQVTKIHLLDITNHHLISFTF